MKGGKEAHVSRAGPYTFVKLESKGKTLQITQPAL